MAEVGTELTDVAGAIVNRDVTESTAEKAKLKLQASVLDAGRLLIEAEGNLETTESILESDDNTETEDE